MLHFSNYVQVYFCFKIIKISQYIAYLQSWRWHLDKCW